MSANRSIFGRAGWVGRAALIVSSVIALSVAGVALAAGEILFPAPLHITRELTDPISGSKSVIDEYCHGNRVVSVNGRRTAIAEYDRGVLTTIDFDAGTYSVTKFEDLARVYEKNVGASIKASANEWRVETRGGRVVASRPGEEIEAERTDAHGRVLVRITADRQLTLSRGALEVLMGSAWPRRADASADVLLGALRSRERRATTNAAAGAAQNEYHLPLEHVTRFEIEGDTVETRNVVLRIGSELPPPDVLAVPPGAKLVESEAIVARRMLEELDGAPAPKP